MKLVAPLILAAAFSLATVAASAKTVTTDTSQNSNDRSVNAVAGPAPHKKVASATDKPVAQPSKKVLRKSKIKPPPPLHDPN